MDVQGAGRRLGLIALLLAGAAPAAPPEAAREAFRRAVKAYDAGDYAAALEGYTRAYELDPRPQTLFNIGQCHRKLSHPAAAAQAYRRYLAGFEGEPPNGALVRELLAEMDARLAEQKAPDDGAEPPERRHAKAGKSGAPTRKPPEEGGRRRPSAGDSEGAERAEAGEGPRRRPAAGPESSGRDPVAAVEPPRKAELAAADPEVPPRRGHLPDRTATAPRTPSGLEGPPLPPAREQPSLATAALPSGEEGSGAQMVDRGTEISLPPWWFWAAVGAAAAAGGTSVYLFTAPRPKDSSLGTRDLR